MASISLNLRRLRTRRTNSNQRDSQSILGVPFFFGQLGKRRTSIQRAVGWPWNGIPIKEFNLRGLNARKWRSGNDLQQARSRNLGDLNQGDPGSVEADAAYS